jgi:hypothetical protein
VTQNLPIGSATSPHAVRLRRRLPRAPGWATRWHALLALAGVGAALLGALFALSPPSVGVSMSDDRYEIAGNRLSASGPGVYEGPGGVLVVAAAGGTTRAAASTTLNGVHMAGRCTLAPGGDHETCDFTLGGQALTAVDTRTADGWHRRYDDGRAVDIVFSGRTPVPVPFAVGR